MFLLFITGLCLIDAVTSASCGQTSFTGLRGTVKSPNSFGSNYANGLKCNYDIIVPSGYKLKLSWSTFDVKGYMPTCYDDYVEIYIGCSSNKRSIGKFCSENSEKPFDVYSPDHCLQLVFKTDSSGNGKGFQAVYERIFPGSSTFLGSGSCSGTKTMYSSSEVIHSYNWPLSDSRSRKCYWKIDVGSYKAIKIAFMDVDLDYDWGCDNDKVKVKGGSSGQSYDSSSTIKSSMCGSEKAFSLTSTKNRIWIRFKSNGYSNRRGFVAGYVLYDATKTSSSGSSGSPITGIVVAIVVFAVVAVCIFYIFVYRRRVLMRQRGAQNQAMPVPLQTSISTTQTTIHHAPPPPQPGYAPPPGSGYAPAPPLGYAPPPNGYPPHPSNAPPPYSQVATAPYPPQEKAAPYPPPQGGAPPYLFGQPGAPAPYPPGQPGATAPYPPGQPGATAPYPPGQPQATAPYPPGQPGATVTNPTAPPVGAAYPPQ